MNTTAEHRVAPEEIMAFFDGELSAADAQSVAAHLDSCSACASLASQFRSLSQSLARWSVAPLSQKLENAVNDFSAKASARSKSRKSSTPFRFSIWNWKLWAFGGTGVVAGALLLLGIEVWNSNRPDRAARPMAMMVSQPSDKGTASYAPPESLKGKMNNSLSAPSRMATRAPSDRGEPISAGFGVAGTVGNLSDTAATTMIAHTASLSITVKDLTSARASLDAMLARHHGYSAQLTVESAANAPRSLTASLRIPVSNLSNAISDLKTLGRVEKESQSGEDVSQQHDDLAERLKTASATEERFRGILQQRTGNISDVLEVEESIARVRGEIESMQAEQTTLEHRVDFATIDLQLSEEYKEEIASTSAAFSLRFHNALVAGYRNAAGTVAGIFLFLVEYGPSILIWLVIIFFLAFLISRRYKKARSRI
jgi:anti-sigma factor RsiW